MNYKVVGLIALSFTVFFLFLAIGNDPKDSLQATTEVGGSEKKLSFSSQKSDENAARPLNSSVIKSVKNTGPDSETSDLKKIRRLLDSSASGLQTNFADEKSLINYLKKTDDIEVYKYIRERLLNAVLASKDGDRLMEYGISLLAAVGTPAATEFLLEIVNRKSWENSEATYLVKKSLEHLNGNGSLNNQIQTAFTNSSENSPFLKELALSLVKSPKHEQVNYLFSNISGEANAKTYAAKNALKSLTQEPMVPTVSRYLDSSENAQVDAALNSLANIGQYEAASTLLAWSAKQSVEQKDNVEKLFEVATNRSPSTRRAIQKEASDLSFASEDIRTVVLSYLDPQSFEGQ